MITTATYQAIFSGTTSDHWMSDLEMNLLFLRVQQNYFNDRLKSHKFVFLNEVLLELGLARTSKGATDGWLLASGNEIDFHPSDPDENGAITLTLITDGIIYDKIEDLP